MHTAKNKKQTTCSLSKEFIVCDLINILFSIYQNDEFFN